jgi:hypothetical protein
VSGVVLALEGSLDLCHQGAEQREVERGGVSLGGPRVHGVDGTLDEQGGLDDLVEETDPQRLLRGPRTMRIA